MEVEIGRTYTLKVGLRFCKNSFLIGTHKAVGGAIGFVGLLFTEFSVFGTVVVVVLQKKKCEMLVSFIEIFLLGVRIFSIDLTGHTKCLDQCSCWK
jgi:hypothetical protein